MKPLAITIKGEYGLLFEGEYPRTYTFVPEDCVTARADGSFQIDKMAYIKRRWAIRNMRFNSVDLTGTQLLPNERKPVVRTGALELAAFLGHLRRGYGAGFTEHSAATRA